MKSFVLAIIFLSINFVFSQDSLVQDGGFPEAELHVAINPLDTNNIVIAVQSGFGNVAAFDVNIYYTQDFGATWNLSSYHGTPSPFTAAGDVVLSFDSSGHVLLVSLGAGGAGVSTILSKSVDDGATWSLETTLGGSFTDKPWLATDRFRGSPYAGNIYIPLVENNVNLYTLDENYQQTSAIIIPGDQLPSVVVKKDGTVFTSTVGLDAVNKIFVQEHINGGSTMVHSKEVVSFPDYTFNAPAISIRFQPTAYLAIDNSGGAYDGRLYLSYTASEASDPDFFDVFLTYSDDNAQTWSTPKTVHSNQEDSVNQFYSSMYVNSQGTLILDWYDRKNHGQDGMVTDFFMGISHDGGASFTEIQLNSAPSDFDHVIASSDSFGIGEYHQLVATENTAISFWSDGRTNDGDLNIYMAKVKLAQNATGIEEQGLISKNISVSALFPQPAQDVAYTNITLQKPTTLKYQILNEAGQKMMDTDWVKYQKGEHKLRIDLDLSAGIYFVKIMSDKGYFKSMKLVKYN